MDGITNSMDTGLGRLPQLVTDREAWSAVGHGVTKELVTTERLTTHCIISSVKSYSDPKDIPEKE